MPQTSPALSLAGPGKERGFPGCCVASHGFGCWLKPFSSFCLFKSVNPFARTIAAQWRISKVCHISSSNADFVQLPLASGIGIKKGAPAVCVGKEPQLGYYKFLLLWLWHSGSRGASSQNRGIVWGKHDRAEGALIQKIDKGAVFLPMTLSILNLENRGPARWSVSSQVRQESCGRTRRCVNLLLPAQRWAAEHGERGCCKFRADSSA